ncbi:MAG: PEP-CTERM sorting domain-containing protein [Armatimonadetes bacterium]|nr:PEP-CTERM sorting domain-containing protein [Armatimonadota bacterium]
MKRTALLVALVAASLSQASIVSVTSGDTLLGNRPSNLLTNGSFEADAGSATNLSYWATGTTLTPSMSLTGWTASGGPQNYAQWGNNGPQLVGSDTIPHGENAVYFGAGIMMPLAMDPTFAPDGSVSFSGNPNIQPKPGFGPVTLSQTVSGLNTSQQYLLDFWASGENAGFSSWGDGFFGLDITGEAQLLLAAPGGLSGLGASQRYYIVFQPTASSVTLTWTNWGHYIDSFGLFHSELVMDDAILNPVPEPGTFLVLGLSLASLAVRRRRRR